MPGKKNSGIPLNITNPENRKTAFGDPSEGGRQICILPMQIFVVCPAAGISRRFCRSAFPAHS
jgi:hypothetical protein